MPMLGEVWTSTPAMRTGSCMTSMIRLATLGRRCLRAVRDDQHELVAAEARDRIDVANDALEALRHLLEQLIADPMAE
jgi:hypothetical protein